MVASSIRALHRSCSGAYNDEIQKPEFQFSTSRSSDCMKSTLYRSTGIFASKIHEHPVILPSYPLGHVSARDIVRENCLRRTARKERRYVRTSKNCV